MISPLHIIALMDGRPGHEKQTQGIVQALEKMTRINVEYQLLPSLSLAATLRNWCALVAATLGKGPHPSAHSDLLIGTGSHTHVPLLLLKQKTGAWAVTCMGSTFPLNLYMDLCFVPSHDRPRLAENIFITTGPPSTAAPKGSHLPDKGLILVGGIDEKSHRWHTNATLEQIETIVQRAPSYHWTISSSPRTPQDTVSKLQDFAEAHAQAAFFNVKDTPRGWIETRYSESSMAWVTADSVSMVYEALTAGCKVGILPVAWKRADNKFQRSIDDLYAAGWAISYEKWHVGHPMPGHPVPLNEAQRCAVEILRRWWPERLP